MKNVRIYLIVILVYVLLLFWRYKVVSNPSLATINNYIEGVILEEPVVSGNRQSFTINGVEVITKRYPEFHYGDVIKIKNLSQGNQKSPPKADQPWAENILSYPKIELIDRFKGNPALGEIYKFRENVVELYQRVLPVREAGLLAGIVLGVKSSLPYDFNEALKKTGTMHVVVASGMNITFIAKFLFLTFGLFLNRRLAVGLSMLGILFYMALAGFQPPIVRAGIMGMIAFSAQILGRQNWGVYSLGMTVLIMLLINPLYIFDLGFQLSVLATSGLLFLQPLLIDKAFIAKVSPWQVTKVTPWQAIFSIPLLGESLSTTISAQIAVTPLIFYNFGTVSLLSPLVNGLILWTVPFVMILGGIMVVVDITVGAIHELPLQVLAYLTYGFLWYFSESVMWFTKLNWGQLLIENPSVFLVVGYYLIIFSLTLFITNKNKN